MPAPTQRSTVTTSWGRHRWLPPKRLLLSRGSADCAPCCSAPSHSRMTPTRGSSESGNTTSMSLSPPRSTASPRAGSAELSPATVRWCLRAGFSRHSKLRREHLARRRIRTGLGHCHRRKGSCCAKRCLFLQRVSSPTKAETLRASSRARSARRFHFSTPWSSPSTRTTAARNLKYPCVRCLPAPRLGSFRGSKPRSKCLATCGFRAQAGGCVSTPPSGPSTTASRWAYSYARGPWLIIMYATRCM